jgi:N,N'-diacetyllegionaminate synthase
MKEIKIKNKIIGPGHPTFIIAEIGMNHNGDVELGKKMIDAAVECGCDAAKFQIFTAEKLVTKDARTYGNEDGHLPDYQQEMYKKHELSKQQWSELKKHCDKKSIIFFASAWDEDNVDLLNDIGGAIFKFGAADITHLPMLEYAAKKKKPIMLSTGMSTIDEVEEAVKTITKYNDQLILLHCVSAYPAKAEDANMLSMLSLKKFGFPIGFSDHTPDVLTDTVAVALGANVIEKHFTTDKKIPGVDHHLSFNPEEMKRMVKEIRLVEKMLGSEEKIITDSEKETRMMARRSVIARVHIPKGTAISKEMLIIKRPGTGLAPKEIYNIIGKKALENIKEDELLTREMYG